MADALAEEIAYYEATKVELLRHHEGKFVLIHGRNLLGAFDTDKAAYEYGVRHLGIIPMLIREVVSGQRPEVIPFLFAPTRAPAP